MSPRTKKVLRWSRRIVLGLLAFIVLAVGGVVIFIHTAPGREFVRGQVQSKLADTFIGGATVGKIEGTPFGELVLNDLVINDPEGKPAVTVKRLAIELALIPLIRQEARIKSVIASDIDVNLRRDAKGELMVGRMIKPSDEKSGWSIDLNNLELRRGHFQIAMADGPMNIDGIEAFGAATIPAIGAIATRVNVRAVWREKRAPLIIDTVAKIDEGVVSVFTLHALAGGVRVTGQDIRFAPGEGAEPPHIDGSFTVDAPKVEVAKLAPQVELPDDISAAIVVRDGVPFSHLRLTGRLGRTPLWVLAGADIRARRVSGLVATNGVDLPTLSKGKVTGTGGVGLLFDAALVNEQPRAAGIATVWGQVQELPYLRAVTAFNTDGTTAETATAIAAPSLHASIAADVKKTGEGDAMRVTLVRSTVIASTANVQAASGGIAPVRGALDVRLAASGALVPAPNLAVAGTVKGKRMRMQDISMSSFDLALDAHDLPTKPRGKAELVVEDLVRGDMQLGQLKLTAANQPDGTIAVALRSAPKFAKWLIELDALVAPPKPREQTWTIDLSRHQVRLGDMGEWKGTTGHLEIGPGRYAIENLASTSAKGQFSLSASIAAHHLDLELAAHAPFGAARLNFDVDAPREFTNPVAWSRLDRTAIRNGIIELDNIDLAKIAEAMGKPGELRGRVDGAIALGPVVTTGKIDIAGVRTPQMDRLGSLNGYISIEPSADNELVPTVFGSIAGIGSFEASTRVALPVRPFDVASWKTLGPDSVKGAKLVVNEIAIEPGLLDRLGMKSELRGRVKFQAEISEGLKSVMARLDVAQLRGDMLAKPVDTRIEAAIDGNKTTAAVLASSGAITLVDAKGELPLTLAQVVANPALLMTTPFKVTATIPEMPAPTLLAVFGRPEVIGGTFGGTISASGTFGAPSVTAKLVATKLQVPPGSRNTPVKVLDKVTVDATYIGGIAKARIQGAQKDGYLDIFATANPAQLKTGSVTIKAKAFDLAPLLVFAPGPAGAMKGRLDADLTVNGLDPVTAKIAGRLSMKNARIPIAPQVGTLRRANIDVVIGTNTMTITADGRMGQGTVKLNSSIALNGAQPTAGEATLTLRKVSPIGTIEPIIDADIKAKLRRETDRWVADININNAVVKIPEDRGGEALKPVGAPTDVVYYTGEKITERPMDKTQPKRAVIVLNVNLGPTHVESVELRGLIKGKLVIEADAEAVGINGTIEAYRGDLDLFGRRYQVERANVRFDGSTDPLLDLAIVHDFPDVTTITAVRGRVSKPELVMSSDPGIYSQSQLLGFLLGGEPNGDPQQGSAREVATSAGASFVANKIGGYVKKALPIDIDVIKYEAATATESASITVGTWLTRSWFLAYRRRVEARPDENSNEAEVEYWISRRVMLEGATGDRGVSGLDLLWRKRY